ncbi:MAG: hypothetical protein FJY76_03285 [Candidatus Aenigmarchaeota archaeon]|nr:hypothetical protein [Candidatus Aenigmarchaeota archaeon]
MDPTWQQEEGYRGRVVICADDSHSLIALYRSFDGRERGITQSNLDGNLCRGDAGRIISDARQKNYQITFFDGYPFDGFDIKGMKPAGEHIISALVEAALKEAGL